MTSHDRTRMKFGVFLGPEHKPSNNPTWDLERDLQFVEHLDKLGFDEAFVGEHHSSGWEIISSPELFIAAAAQRTRHIKLGTGVISLPYHHPLMVAERMTLLDHLTRGRLIMGVGPGALPSDAAMMGLEYSSLRERMEESLEAILALFTSDGCIDRKTEWFELRQAQLQMLPYTRPHPELAVTAVISPAGAMLAGRFGLPMLALAAATDAGSRVLAEHWDIYSEQRALHGHGPGDRRDWRLVSVIHVAPTREEAERQVSYAMEDAGRYLFRDASFLKAIYDSSGLDEGAPILDVFRASNLGVVGTPQDAIEHIERMQEMSGGYGTHLIRVLDWASPQDTLNSYELFAREVVPHFQDSNRRRIENWNTFHNSEGDFQVALGAANARARKRYEDTKSNRL
ncbi:LLM class flavin-dependent oxidoreductase [Rhodococcus sp. IEGM 1307]|uniref:LLM class flavin-dependent oxidoreductase n=1 Tax=Rhodococcus sp. IEGM 1307 TaxID=3047091 RepID=UPI0024B75883|nr:LLM class flavin-dependent oxidoreductase [Rhodococcus sp. IEGM 1307]MDI9977097.1 LLM class flavin-dependent oxidoreductase [Rhodococcus sp. IEGM 1307]